MRFDRPFDGRKIVTIKKRKWWFDKVSHEWEVLTPFRFYYDDKFPCRFVLVNAGWRTDLASIPGFLGFVLQKDGVYTQAAVAHDWAYKNRGDVVYVEDTDGKIIKIKPLTRKEQDEMFIRAMEVLGTNLPTRFLMWRAVRRFGWIRYPK